MKNAIKISTIIIALVLVGCKKIDASKGTKEDHQVDLTTFTSVDMAISGEMNYTQSTSTSIVVNCSEKVFKALDITVKDSHLHFGLKKGYILTNTDDIKITVTSPDINALSVSGSGSIKADFLTDNIPNLDLDVSGSGLITTNQINGTTVKQTVSGSGDLTTLISATSIQSNISGSGLITTDGSANSSNLTISGSGSFQGFELITADTKVSVSGSGMSEVYADSSLIVNISGSGSVHYKGSPGITSTGSGSGALINAN